MYQRKETEIGVKIGQIGKGYKKKIELLVQLNEYREAVIESLQSAKQDQGKFYMIHVINYYCSQIHFRLFGKETEFN